jgi:hypothetical protein
MSKPNLLGFSSSVGIYRNKRMRDLRQILAKQIPRKVPFADLSTMCFQALMAYAAENQIDGDFSDYTSGDVAGIFCTNCINVSLGEASAIWKAFDSVGLLEGGKIRSWAKFNRHFAEHEKIVKAKRRAGKLSRQKWLKELSQQAAGIPKNGHVEHEKPAPKPVQNPSRNESVSRQLFELNQALDIAPTAKAKAALNRQKVQLLANQTGVDLSPASPSPAPPPSAPKKSEKQKQEDWHRGMAKAGRESIEAGNYDILSESMVRALIADGYDLPPEVQSRFRKLLKESANPVPE